MNKKNSKEKNKLLEENFEENLLGLDQIDDIVKAKVKAIKKRNAAEELAFRLTSRKFWLASIVSIYFMIKGYNSTDAIAIFGYLTQVVVSFLAIQGGVDALSRIAESRITKQRSESNFGNVGELDPNVINAGQNLNTRAPLGD